MQRKHWKISLNLFNKDLNKTPQTLTWLFFFFPQNAVILKIVIFTGHLVSSVLSKTTSMSVHKLIQICTNYKWEALLHEFTLDYLFRSCEGM